MAFATEIIYALGFENNLVFSGEMDRQSAAFPVNKDQIITSKPDLILIDSRDLERADLINQEKEMGHLLDKPVEILHLPSNSLTDILNAITPIAQQLSVSIKGDDLREELQDRINIIGHKLKFVDDRRMLAVVTDWVNGECHTQYLKELSLMSGVSLLAQSAWEEVRLADPDFLIFASAEQNLAQSLKNIEHLLQLPGFDQLKAVKNKQLFIADGSRHFYKPSLSLIDSLEILAEIVHPKQFVFGYEGEAWVRFDL